MGPYYIVVQPRHIEVHGPNGYIASFNSFTDAEECVEYLTHNLQNNKETH